MARKTPVQKKPAAAAAPKAKPVASTPVRNSPIPKVSGKPGAAAKVAAAAAKQIVTHDMIAVRAYEISRSGIGGSEFDNWVRAERELRGV